MTQYLLFHLYGPMMSFGEAATGEIRGTEAHPSKSAVLGLVAAALGFDRRDTARHAALARDLRLAVRIFRRGRVLVDYHTVQAPPSQKTPYLTRRAELESPGLSTILSQRSYLQDALFTVALSSVAQEVNLAELAEALRRPHWVPYLGRKSCPLALPLEPVLCEAANLAEAFAAAALPEEVRALLAPLLNGRTESQEVCWEGDDPFLKVIHTASRRDVPLQRHRPLWDSRSEHRGTLP